MRKRYGPHHGQSQNQNGGFCPNLTACGAIQTERLIPAVGQFRLVPSIAIQLRRVPI